MPILYLLMMISLTACNTSTQQLPAPPGDNNVLAVSNPYTSIGIIPPPAGFTRKPADNNSFAVWLRRLPLKKNKTVYLYNGLPKANQSAQFAVINIPTGNRDLQQCADAVMRLRAEYLYEQKKIAAIDFADNNGRHYRLPANAGRAAFDRYLETVFSSCGTASLNKQLVAVKDFKQIAAGDVLVKAGFPGHAMQVIDIAVNKAGKKIYLLAQGYMPAQDMHVVINPANSLLSPWYEETEGPFIETPEWTFSRQHLKKWPVH